MTLLHACVRFDPPLSVLLKIIHLHPEALRKEDCIGRTPLHVAAGSGASFFVMKVLTTMYPGACNVQDEDGRTPLHFACDSSCELFEGDEECSSRGPPNLDTVRVLLAGSLEAVTLEDAEEMNAVEYAILSNAPIEVVIFLQKAMRRVMEMKKSKMVSSPRSSPGSTVMSNIQELKI
jgi:ankyrin repeat protein